MSNQELSNKLQSASKIMSQIGVKLSESQLVQVMKALSSSAVTFSDSEKSKEFRASVIAIAKNLEGMDKKHRP